MHTVYLARMVRVQLRGDGFEPVIISLDEPTRHHVAVANGLHLVHTMQLNQGVKPAVQTLCRERLLVGWVRGLKPYNLNPRHQNCASCAGRGYSRLMGTKKALQMCEHVEHDQEKEYLS